MVSAIVSNPFMSYPPLVSVVFWLTLFIGILVCALFLYVLVLRVMHGWHQRREQRFRDRWRPVMFEWLAGNKVHLPRVREGDRLMLMDLWQRIRHQIDDSGATALDQLALELKLDEVASRVLQYRKARDENRKIWLQLLAVETARVVYTDIAKQALVRAAESGNFRVNIAATCALINRDHENAQMAVLSSLLQFDRWAPLIISKVSQAGGSDILHLIASRLDRLSDTSARNFISLSEYANDRSLLPVLVRILHGTEDLEEQASVLRTIGRLKGHKYLDDVLPFLNHHRPELRLRAAVTVGEIGTHEDADLLLPLLSDPDWWVRYRATQSYFRLANPEAGAVEDLIQACTKQETRDMLRHVRAELAL